MGIAVYLSACIINESQKAVLKVFEGLGVSCGTNSHEFVAKEDERRISTAEQRAHNATREGRMAFRQVVVERRQGLSARAAVKTRYSDQASGQVWEQSVAKNLIKKRRKSTKFNSDKGICARGCKAKRYSARGSVVGAQIGGARNNAGTGRHFVR